MVGAKTTRTQWIGAPVRRREDPMLLRGDAKFVADIEPPETLHAAFLRSPVAHARISGIDVSSALEVEGVVDIVHARVLDAVPGPIPVRVHPIAKLEPYRQYALAIDKVRYVGEPIAAVVASNRYIAEDAAQLIEAEFDALPAVVDIEAAAGSESPSLFEVRSNVAFEFSSTYGDVDAAFADAAHVVSGDFIVNRHSGVPLETRGLVAQWDSRLARLTMWGPTKVIHANRDVVANLLGLGTEQVRFVEPAVGGGFGIRGRDLPGGSRRTASRHASGAAGQVDRGPRRAHGFGKPIARPASRARRSPSTQTDGFLGCAAISTSTRARTFARTACGSPRSALTHSPALTRFPPTTQTSSCVVTNKTPTGTYRAPGRFEINFVREQLIDMAARELGVEARALRRRNLIQPEDMPYSPGTRDFDEPVVFDTGDVPAVFERTVEAIGYDQVRQLQASMPPGKCLGVGVVPFIEDGGLGGLGRTPGEYARVAIEMGRVVVYCGAGDLGQGFGTMLSQICAEELGLDPAAIEVVRGDTDLVPQGGGTWASRGAILAGNAALEASRGVAAKLRERSGPAPGRRSR